MKSRIDKAILVVVLLVLTATSNACLVPPQPTGNQPSIISGLEAEYINVYPRGTSEIRCVVSAPEDSGVKFIWSCTGGNIVGDGSTVTWEAPSDYGDYHIMVIAKDASGGSSEAVLTMSVVPRPYSGCCGGRR